MIRKTFEPLHVQLAQVLSREADHPELPEGIEHEFHLPRIQRPREVELVELPAKPGCGERALAVGLRAEERAEPFIASFQVTVASNSFLLETNDEIVMRSVARATTALAADGTTTREPPPPKKRSSRNTRVQGKHAPPFLVQARPRDRVLL